MIRCVGLTSLELSCSPTHTGGGHSEAPRNSRLTTTQSCASNSFQNRKCALWRYGPWSHLRQVVKRVFIMPQRSESKVMSGHVHCPLHDIIEEIFPLPYGTQWRPNSSPSHWGHIPALLAFLKSPLQQSGSMGATNAGLKGSLGNFALEAGLLLWGPCLVKWFFFVLTQFHPWTPQDRHYSVASSLTSMCTAHAAVIPHQWASCCSAFAAISSHCETSRNENTKLPRDTFSNN